MHGETGYLSQVGDTDSMVLNALLLLQNESQLKRFKRQAQLKAEKFNLNIVVDQYEKIYVDAIETI